MQTTAMAKSTEIENFKRYLSQKQEKALSEAFNQCVSDKRSPFHDVAHSLQQLKEGSPTFSVFHQVLGDKKFACTIYEFLAIEQA